MVGSLGGCADPMRQMGQDLQALHATGRYDAAAALLDQEAAQGTFGEKNRLLYWLDRGAVALAQDDTAKAIEMLEKAEAVMDVQRESTTGDEIARWLVNDTAAAYVGEPYEDIYVNVLKLLAQLERGEIQGGATVEARRMAGKADVLRDRYLRTLEAVNKKGTSEVRGFSTPTLGSERFSSAGEFVESSLGTYLTAVTFMKSGEPESQSVAARRLATAIESQGRLIGPVRAADFQGLGDVKPSEANAMFVAVSGRGPTKVPQQFGPIPLYTYTIYFELPELRGGSAEVDQARVVFDDGLTPVTLALVEDMGLVAKANHERQLPLVYARSFLRSSLKAAAVAVGTEAARRGTRKKETAQAAVEIIGILGGLLLVTQTEKADLRCWSFLPARAHVALAKLPPGEHPARIEYLSGGRVVFTTAPRTIRVGDGPGDLATMVGHYWR